MSKKDYSIFWRWFWITIFILLAVYFIIEIVILKKTDFLSEDKNQKPSYEKLLSKLQKNSPGILKIIEESSNISKKKIKKSISENIDKAYKSLYFYIDDFSDFHYSVQGEYTELLFILQNKMSKILEERLFKPAGFQTNLNDALKNINSDMIKILKNDFIQIQEQIKNLLKINDNEVEFLFTDIFKITKEDTIKRFTDFYPNLFKSAGTLFSIKLFSKAISKKLATKLAAKATLKTGAKAAGVTGAAVTGAEAGTIFGPVGTAVGGIIGAVVGWIATDKIVIEVDKVLNEEDFKAQIKDMIDKQKNRTKETLYKFYFSNISQIKQKNQKSIDNLKKRPIKELMGI